MLPNKSAVASIANEWVIPNTLKWRGRGGQRQRQAFGDGYLLERFFEQHARGTSNLLQVSVQLRVGCAPVGALAAVFFKVGDLQQQLCQVAGALTSHC